ncbi:putative transcription initiation factor [Podospora fimiseda]|uniref:Transcription initiation factor IIF subunit beta n=1 Tax=Podospora fimiseda TaxID=252190 RepID=A0AAN7BN61_9PEZI|nr:putative transcription initiation factor [Podospora fimiseda]
MAEPVIKPDPEAGSPMMEDDLDESADLDFFDKLPQADMFNKMYLARLPPYLWEAWSHLDDDAEIEIGRIRQWFDKDGNTKLQMRLHPHKLHVDEAHGSLPREYNLDLTNMNVQNTFVFAEQDLPSYAAKNKERANALAQGIPAHLLRQKQQAQEQAQGGGSGGGDRSSRRGAPYTRKAIPKKTTITGRIKHEVLCTPVSNAETERFLWRRAKKSQTTEKKVVIYERLPAQGVSSAKEWDSFLKMNAPISKQKKMENKATRWPENRLLDEIAKCFSQHKYWSIKTFRAAIPQPEAYLRETLDKIAVLHRTGTFANHWSLKPEYQGMLSQTSQPLDDAAAPNAVDLPSDDEDEVMEDVL